MGAPGWPSWLNIAAEVGIILLPVGLLMIAGEVEISVGTVVSAASMTTALLAGHHSFPAIIPIPGRLSVGLAVCFVIGVLVTRTAMPSLFVTVWVAFAVMELTLGFAVLTKGSTSISYLPTAVTKTLLGLFMASGFCAAFVGVAQVMTYPQAEVAGGQASIFHFVMCVVIGGVLLTVCAGSIVGIVLGTMAFAVVNQCTLFAAFDPNIGSIIIGTLLLAAILSNDTFRTLALNAAAKKT